MSEQEIQNEEEKVRLPPSERPRLKSIQALRAKSNETKKIYIEFAGTDDVLEIEIKMSFSLNLLDNAREYATVPKYPKRKVKAGKPVETIFKPMLFYEYVWGKVVVSTDPPSTFNDIRITFGTVGADIVERIIDEIENSAGDYKVLKKE